MTAERWIYSLGILVPVIVAGLILSSGSTGWHFAFASIFIVFAAVWAYLGQAD